jgi:hypothetical protein
MNIHHETYSGTSGPEPIIVIIVFVSLSVQWSSSHITHPSAEGIVRSLFDALCGNLAVAEALNACSVVRDVTNLANEVAAFSRHSTRFHSLIDEASASNHPAEISERSSASICPLCPTRVLCRGPALKTM